MSLPIIGEKKLKKAVYCMNCGRPLMDEDNFRLRKRCPSCKLVNVIILGPDLSITQIIDHDAPREAGDGDS